MPITDSVPLDVPISLEELKAAALNMQRNKSPGFDGIPLEVYVEFWDELGPLLLDMIMTSIDKGSIQNYMPTLVSCDQTGFVKSRLASDNVRRLLHIIDAATGKKNPAAVTSFDAYESL